MVTFLEALGHMVYFALANDEDATCNSVCLHIATPHEMYAWTYCNTGQCTHINTNRKFVYSVRCSILSISKLL